MKRIIIGGLSVSALLIAASLSSASAADMPLKAPPPPPAPVYNWTGAYIGVNIGGGWSDRNVSYSPNDPLAAVLFAPPVNGAPPATSFKDSGVLGGLQLGYNWQFNPNWLVGLETDFDWSGMKGSASSSGALVGINPFANTVTERLDWFGTVRARLGYLPTNNLLTYITGGFAYGQIRTTGNYVSSVPVQGNFPPFGFSCTAGTTCFSGTSGSSTGTGWTVGAGFEYALWKNVTFKAEYLYVSLNSKSITETALTPFNGNPLLSSFNANFNNMAFSVARAGFNYRF